MSERQTPLLKTDSTHHQSQSDPNSQNDMVFGDIPQSDSDNLKNGSCNNI